MSTHPFDLTGRTALVTGASRGIGRAMARALAAAGADIVGVSTTMAETGRDLASEIERLGRRFVGLSCDLGDRPEVERLVRDLDERAIAPNILVNNAGLIRRAPAAEHPDDWWDEVLAVNLTAPFLLARALGSRMVERGWGRIIFVGSILSFQGGILVPSYAASKGGVLQLARALANEWGASGVTVNTLAPGYIATDNTAALQSDPDRAGAILSRIPLARWGKPADLEGPVVFLASESARYVNGSAVTVDGGWMTR
jgi:2-dehydro-3-deoxy-D-gluconate 5-dehydrogenase